MEGGTKWEREQEYNMRKSRISSLGETICCKRTEWRLDPRMDACRDAEMQRLPPRWSIVEFLYMFPRHWGHRDECPALAWRRLKVGLDRVTHNGGTSVYTFHQDQEGSPLNSSAQEYWGSTGAGAERSHRDGPSTLPSQYAPGKRHSWIWSFGVASAALRALQTISTTWSLILYYPNPAKPIRN